MNTRAKSPLGLAGIRLAAVRLAGVPRAAVHVATVLLAAVRMASVRMAVVRRAPSRVAAVQRAPSRVAVVRRAPWRLEAVRMAPFRLPAVPLPAPPVAALPAAVLPAAVPPVAVLPAAVLPAAVPPVAVLPAAVLPVAVLLLAALLVAGCGGSLTAGGFAEVDVAVSGDAPGGNASPRASSVRPASTRAPGVRPASNAPGVGPASTRATGVRSALPAPGIPPITTFDDDDDDPEGEIELEFRLFLVRPDGSEEALSRDEIEVEVDLSGDIEVDAIRATVPAERYTGLRIVFSEIEVQIDRGVVIGGVPVTGHIDIELEDDELVEVVRPLDLNLREGDRVELLVDINAGVWLQAIDPNLRKVAERVFAEAISVVVR